MKTLKLSLKKLPEDQFTSKSIELRTNDGDAIGLIVCDGCFVPCPDIELYPNELQLIAYITRNFWLFYDNINEKTI